MSRRRRTSAAARGARPGPTPRRSAWQLLLLAGGLALILGYRWFMADGASAALERVSGDPDLALPASVTDQAGIEGRPQGPSPVIEPPPDPR